MRKISFKYLDCPQLFDEADDGLLDELVFGELVHRWLPIFNTTISFFP